MTERAVVSRETSAALEALPAPVSEAIRRLAGWTATHAAPLGLTHFATPDEALAHGIAPAFTLVHLWGQTPPATCVELGPGSGVLGLTVALLCPGLLLTLIDRRRRVIDYLELLIARESIPNALALLADPARMKDPRKWDAALFRALAQPRAALAMAADLAQDAIYAFHSPAVTAYASPPAGFAPPTSRPTLAPNLHVTAYRRSAP